MLKKSNRGFTLIEMIAVLVLLGIVLGIAAPAIFKQMNKGRIKATAVQIAALEQSLTAFNLDCGFFPDTAQGIVSLVQPPTTGTTCKDYDQDGYLKKKTVPQDPWKQDYVYVSPGENNSTSYDLSSIGPDKTAGTDDDIINW